MYTYNPAFQSDGQQYGYLPNGPRQAPAVAGPGQVARFRLAIDVATGANDAGANVDVYDATTNQVLA